MDPQQSALSTSAMQTNKTSPSPTAQRGNIIQGNIKKGELHTEMTIIMEDTQFTVTPTH